MAESLKHKTFKGTVWSSIERFSVQGVAFVVMIIMARILTPADYGLVGMLTIFIAISQSLIDCGFSQALIRKQGRTEVDNSTVFYFNIAVGFLLYAILFFAAPLIADFYEEPQLVILTRVLCVSVFLNSLVVVQRALLTVEIDFKTQAKASFIGAIAAGVIGVWSAYGGYGVWAIVYYQLSNILINVVLLWILSKWRPKWTFSWKSFKELFGFGSKLAGSGLIDTLYNNIYLVVIGKVFKASDLGYYSRASQFAQFPSSNFTGIIQRVTFPVLCSIQNNDEKLKHAFINFIRISALIVFPMMVGLAILAKPLIIIVLKVQWVFSANLLSIICFSLLWFPIHALNLNLVLAKGRSDYILKAEVMKKVIGISLLCLTIPLGLKAMCYASILTSILSLIVNAHYTGNVIGVGFCLQIKNLMPTIIIVSGMSLVVLLASSLFSAPWLKLLIGSLIGILFYSIAIRVFNAKDYKALISFIKSR